MIMKYYKLFDILGILKNVWLKTRRRKSFFVNKGMYKMQSVDS